MRHTNEDAVSAPVYSYLFECPKCRSEQDVVVTSRKYGAPTVARTKCLECGHEDYWAYGFYQGDDGSSTEGVPSTDNT